MIDSVLNVQFGDKLIAECALCEHEHVNMVMNQYLSILTETQFYLFEYQMHFNDDKLQF